MFCILQCKGAIDENLTLAENEEDLTNHKDNDTCMSPVISCPIIPQLVNLRLQMYAFITYSSFSV